MKINTVNYNRPLVLVTGSEGNLAQWCIPKLIDQYQVVGVDHCGRYGVVDRPRNYEFVAVDLRDLSQVKQLFQNYKFDFILHCAAEIYGVRGFHIYSADIIHNNLVTCSNLLSQSVEHCVKKFVFISSSMVYENATEFPLKEECVDLIPAPSTGYGMSKYVGERMLKEYQTQYNLTYTVWRPFNIVTPNERSDKEPGIAHVMADLIEKIIHQNQKKIQIFGNGDQVRCFTWIDDVAEIICKQSFDVATDNQVYNLGSEVPTKIIDLAKKIHSASGRQDLFVPEFVDIYHDDVKYRIPDCSRAKTLGWHHTKSIDELVDICIKGSHQ